MKTCNAPKTAFDYLCKFSYASAGPNGNLTGMRKLYWGKNALVVRCCGYLFNVPPFVFDRYAWGK